MRSECLKMMAESLNPLARAAVMKSLCSVVVMLSRMRRATLPAKNSPSVKVGSTMCFGESHRATGSHWSFTAKIITSTGPMTNPGMHTISSETKPQA